MFEDRLAIHGSVNAICFASSRIVLQRRTFDPGAADDDEEYVMTLAKQ